MQPGHRAGSGVGAWGYTSVCENIVWKNGHSYPLQGQGNASWHLLKKKQGICPPRAFGVIPALASSFPLPGDTADLLWLGSWPWFCFPCPLEASILSEAERGFADSHCSTLHPSYDFWRSRAGSKQHPGNALHWCINPCVSATSVRLTSGDGVKEPKQTVVVASRISCTRDFLSLVTDFVVFLCGICKPIICKCFHIKVLLWGWKYPAAHPPSHSVSEAQHWISIYEYFFWN